MLSPSTWVGGSAEKTTVPASTPTSAAAMRRCEARMSSWLSTAARGAPMMPLVWSTSAVAVDSGAGDDAWAGTSNEGRSDDSLPAGTPIRVTRPAARLARADSAAAGLATSATGSSAWRRSASTLWGVAGLSGQATAPERKAASTPVAKAVSLSPSTTTGWPGWTPAATSAAAVRATRSRS